MNHKRLYRLYREEGLEVRTKKRRRKRASHVRLLVPPAQRPNERWSMDFVTDRLESGRSFRVLTVVDQFSRECPLLEPGVSMTGKTVARALERLSFTHPLPTGNHGRQWLGILLPGDGLLGVPERRAVGVYSAGKAGGECVYREFQRTSSRRMPQRQSVLPRSMTRAENWRLGGSITIPNGHTAH